MNNYPKADGKTASLPFCKAPILLKLGRVARIRYRLLIPALFQVIILLLIPTLVLADNSTTVTITIAANVTSNSTVVEPISTALNWTKGTPSANTVIVAKEVDQPTSLGGDFVSRYSTAYSPAVSQGFSIHPIWIYAALAIGNLIYYAVEVIRYLRRRHEKV